MPPILQPASLQIHNTTVFPLEVAVSSSPQQATTTTRTVVAARGAAHLRPSASRQKRRPVELSITRADGETLVFTEDRKRRRRGGQSWSAMVLTPADGAGTITAAATAHGHPADSTSTLDGGLPKPGWPLKAFYHKVRVADFVPSQPGLTFHD